LCDGESFKTAYDTFKINDQLVAIGINCTNPKYISSLLKSAQREPCREKPFIVYPNDGSAWDSQTQSFIPQSDEDSFVSLIPEWVDLGAKYIGGCCQISSKKLRIMFEKINEIEKNLR
jgi:homocysteine S-methyltransferase